MKKTAHGINLRPSVFARLMQDVEARDRPISGYLDVIDTKG